MAENENPDSWVLVDSPEKTDTEQPAAEPEPESADSKQDPQPEPEPEPEQPAEPESQPEPEQPPQQDPEPEKPAEPEPASDSQPEPEQPAEPEPEQPAEPEPEQPAEPEPEPDQPAEPEPEPEQPAQPEPESEQPDSKPEEPPTEQQPEAEKPAEPEPQPEPESEPKPVPEQPAESESTAKEDTPPKATEDKPADDKPTETDDKPTEEGGAGDVTVELEVEIGGDAPVVEEPKEVVPEPGEDVEFGTYLQLCRVGSDMIKVKKSKGFPRQYRLDKDLLSIVWNSRHKPANKARIIISAITEIRAGRSTETFKASKDTHPEEVCFSILYLEGNTHKTLDLAALTAEDKTAWVEGLKALQKYTARGGEDTRSKVRDRWLKDLFDGADKDGSGSLDMKEVLNMMHQLNVGVSSKQLKRKFKKADNGTAEGAEDGKLDFNEFSTLFKDLATRPELTVLFSKYSSKMEWLTVKDLQKFLQMEQGAVDPSVEFCTQLIQKYEPTDEGKAQGWMSLDGFTQFMLGPENDIINVDRSTVVYQDMTQPLSHYYIASSHNTYLLEDQLKGPSSCEAYIRALRKGCRCVELDCWDGPDGEPIIFHGHTLTSKILFEEVIKAIRDHAFAVSQYPVILSIENHCSIPQQHRMAELMKEILGEMLYDADRDETRETLPSPAELKGKILVKGKKLKKELEAVENDDGEVTDEDEAQEIDESELVKVKPKEEAKPAEAETKPAEDKPAEDKPAEDKPAEDKPAEDKPAEDKPAEDKPAEDKPAEDKPAEDKPAEDKPAEDKPAEDKPAEDKPAEDKPAEDKPAAAAEAAPTPGKQQRSRSFSRKRKPTVTERPKKKIKLSAKLSKCINYIQSVHFPGIEGYDGVTPVSAKCWEMSSFGESTAVRLSRESAVRYVTYNKRQISRTYPKGSRVDSSNYDPTPMWNTGCQIVALNYQTPGKPMDLNEGKFRDNGGCGYLLKPSIMREDLSRFDHNQRNVHFSGFSPKVITINVISGQHLPKPGDKKGEVIDPYVVLQLVGADCDSQRVKTKTINDNGFNPQWNQSFQFQVRFPDLAVLRIKVMDEDWGPNPDDFIGSYALPISCLVPGYRHVHLNKSGNKLETGSLFIHVQIQDHVAPHRTFGKAKTMLKTKRAREYPEYHQTGHQSIDVHFRNLPGPLHRAVDHREDFVFALLYFKELVGQGPHASVGECVELLAARAKSAGIKLQLEQMGETDETEVYRVGVVQAEGVVTAPPMSLQQLLDAFNTLNIAIHTLLKHAPPTINELEKIAKEAKEQEGSLKEHLRESPVPAKRPDLVFDHYARTMFTITSEASQLSATKDEAADTLRKLFSASQGAGIELKTSQ